jgi:hypothetical protein
MKSLLIILNWLMAFCAMSIDTELSPLWTVASCVAWFGVASWLLVKYASPTDARQALVKVCRFFRSLFRPKFDFGEFNKRLEREIEAKTRSKWIDGYYRWLRLDGMNRRSSDFKWLEKPPQLR